AVKDFGIHGTPDQIARCFSHAPMTSLFADNFFNLLGAKETVSVDRSDFEGATLLHDLNEQFPENLRGQFDMVFDGGTLEHIFDYPAALRHCLELLHIGGHFVTITPASGHMGHGFYQFSPELFFRVFSAENGFALRKIVLYDCSKTDADFYEVKDPARTGRRTELATSGVIQMAVLAQKIAVQPMFARAPQQSDYAAAWENHQSRAQDKDAQDASGALRRLRIKMNPYWPFWLRHLRDYLRYRLQHGRPTLKDHCHFRRLAPEEIFRERQTDPAKK
ncbi:MAG TPA: hypothetical protein VK769_02340, partial [Verrucomicrobiae bacterium]|nr:hypothetical protein [Verrucomicrobiae bacterium]